MRRQSFSHSSSVLFLFIAALCLTGSLPTLHAAITPDGDVSPALPWNSSTTGYIGNTSNGALTVNSNSLLNSGRSYIGYNSGVTGMATVDGNGSSWMSDWDLCVGYQGIGTLNITNGAHVSFNAWTNNCRVQIASSASSKGTVKVAGMDSAWTITGCALDVGWSGGGSLEILDSGRVSSIWATIGCLSGSTGTVTVDGFGSVWNNSTDLDIGGYSQGTLNISGGGLITAPSTFINSLSLLAIDIGNNSLLNLGNGAGSIRSDGTVRILAGAKPTANDVYSPISADVWFGSGSCQAVGGTWDAVNHEFTVSDVEYAMSGTEVEINLADTQRVLIYMPGSICSVGTSFLAADSMKTLTMTATGIVGTPLLNLEGMLDDGESVLRAWDFAFSSGYDEGDPVYLSFGVGAGYSRDNLQVWHYDATEGWTDFDAVDLSYDGQYANFTVTGFSGYAVSGVMVPEPGTLAMLLGLAIFLALRHCRRER